MDRIILILAVSAILLEDVLVSCNSDPCRATFNGDRFMNDDGTMNKTRCNYEEECQFFYSEVLDKCVEFLQEKRNNEEKEAAENQPDDSKTAAGGFLAQGGSAGKVKETSEPACIQLCKLNMVFKRYGCDERKFNFARFNRTCSATPRRTKRRVQDCLYNQDINCNVADEYRTLDGTCNNIADPAYGASFTPLERLIEPDYADGIQSPRTSSLPNTTLPGARNVSIAIMRNIKTLSPIRTMLHMTFGQMLTHDIDRVANTMVQLGNRMVDVPCGTGCNTTGPENTACFPIELSEDDPDYNKTCLKFVRTQEVLPLDCGVGPREQLNQITSYLDASFVYGSTVMQSNALRDLTRPDRGILKTTPHSGNLKPLLPQKDVPACRNQSPRDGISCFNAGDGRVNEHIGLISLHTMFHRYHNFIENQLYRVNRLWSGEKLFQEARKILTAQWENIVLDEYLSSVIGPELMMKYSLTPAKYGYRDVYKIGVNAQISNAAATAAFRFGHSQIPGNLMMANEDCELMKNVTLSSVMRDPNEIYRLQTLNGQTMSTPDAVIKGHICQQAEKTDANFDKQITFHMFTSTPNGPGMDLASINIHRGREHGLPAYNKWRQYCGLEVYTSFDGMTDIPAEIRTAFKELYAHVDDVDLFAAGVTETHLPGAAVGPTFGCIIAISFQRLVFGDRFWFERPGQFTLDQLKSIKESPLSRVFCDAGDEVDNIQKFVLSRPRDAALASLGAGKTLTDLSALHDLYSHDSNAVGSCSFINRINFNLWRDTQGVGNREVKSTATDKTLTYNPFSGLIFSQGRPYTVEQYRIKYCNFMTKIAEENSRLSSFYVSCNVDDIRSGSAIFDCTLTFQDNIPLSDSEIRSEIKSDLGKFPEFGFNIEEENFTQDDKNDDGDDDGMSTTEVVLIVLGAVVALTLLMICVVVCYVVQRNKDESARGMPNPYYNYGMDPQSTKHITPYNMDRKMQEPADFYRRQWKPQRIGPEFLGSHQNLYGKNKLHY